MNEPQMREAALRIATSHAQHDTPFQRVMVASEVFYRFIRGEELRQIKRFIEDEEL